MIKIMPIPSSDKHDLFNYKVAFNYNGASNL